VGDPATPAFKHLAPIPDSSGPSLCGRNTSGLRVRSLQVTVRAVPSKAAGRRQSPRQDANRGGFEAKVALRVRGKRGVITAAIGNAPYAPRDCGQLRAKEVPHRGYGVPGRRGSSPADPRWWYLRARQAHVAHRGVGESVLCEPPKHSGSSQTLRVSVGNPPGRVPQRGSGPLEGAPRLHREGPPGPAG
jgi:hypothetical protein